MHYVYHKPRKGLCCLIFYFFCIFVCAFFMLCLIMIQMICLFLNVGFDISVFTLFLQILKVWLTVMKYCLKIYKVLFNLHEYTIQSFFLVDEGFQITQSSVFKQSHKALLLSRLFSKRLTAQYHQHRPNGITFL